MHDLNILLEKIYEKALKAAERNLYKIPYTADGNGTFDDMTDINVCWWTNGFWAGMLWQLYGFRENGLLRECAEEIEEKLDRNLLDAGGMDHDSGFKWFLTSGANLTLTGSRASRNRLLLAADNLAGRFNLAGRYIRAWNDGGDGRNAGLAIIDCVMNLPLLYKASELTNDPRYRFIAEAHAHTAMERFVRPDGSCEHIVVFDPETGTVVDKLGGQGMGPGSAWTRGQAWGIYGFTLSWRHTGNMDYLDTAGKIADFFIAHIPASGLIPVDFMQDAGCPWEDGIAAACAACGLLELGRATGEERYSMAAERLLTALWEKRCDLDPARDNLLTHCSVAYHDARHNFPIVYGDYFFTEALLKLAGKETFLW